MERFYEEVEGKVWSEKDIRKELFKQVLNKQQEQVEYFLANDDVDTLDSDNELLKLALVGKIEDVIDELTNVNRWNFINIDNIFEIDEYTDNVCRLREMRDFFGKYYAICNSVKNTFEYQAIDDKYLNNIKIIINCLVNINRVLDAMEGED